LGGRAAEALFPRIDPAAKTTAGRRKTSRGSPSAPVEEPELPAAELAKVHMPGLNAGASLPRELLLMAAIGIFTILIVALVVFRLELEEVACD